MKKLVPIIAAVLTACVGYIGFSYYDWVSSSESPFDEIGIGLHGYMPGFIQDWGCGKLELRFGGKTLSPYGCGDAADPTKWKHAD